MSITVDERTYQPTDLGVETFGQLMSLVQKEDRLIVQLLIDGNEPDLSRMNILRKAPVAGHTVYVETAEPRRMASDVLTQVENNLDEAEAQKAEAAELLQNNQPNRALEKLSRCFSVWQNAQESVVKTAELLRIDLARLKVGDRLLIDVLEDFKAQLRTIRLALENRDFVSLSDSLTYETTETTAQWRKALQTLRGVVNA